MHRPDRSCFGQAAGDGGAVTGLVIGERKRKMSDVSDLTECDAEGKAMEHRHRPSAHKVYVRGRRVSSKAIDDAGMRELDGECQES